MQDQGTPGLWRLWISVSPSVASAKLIEVCSARSEAGTAHLNVQQLCGGEGSS